MQCIATMAVNNWLSHIMYCDQNPCIGRSHTAAMLASRLQWTMQRNVRKRTMHTSTDNKMHVVYVATIPLHCFNYFCTLTETSQYTRLAHVCLWTYACYVYERSVALFIVDGQQAWPRCGISLLLLLLLIFCTMHTSIALMPLRCTCIYSVAIECEADDIGICEPYLNTSWSECHGCSSCCLEWSATERRSYYCSS